MKKFANIRTGGFLYISLYESRQLTTSPLLLLNLGFPREDTLLKLESKKTSQHGPNDPTMSVEVCFKTSVIYYL